MVANHENLENRYDQKQPERLQGMLTLSLQKIFICTVSLFVLSGYVWATDLSPTIYKLPIRIETEYVISDLKLAIPLQAIGQSLTEFRASDSLGEADNALLALFDEINDDTPAVSEPKYGIDHTNNLLQAYRSLKNKPFQNPTIHSRLLLPGKVIYVWQTKRNNKLFVSTFEFSNSTGELKWNSKVGSSVLHLLTSAIQHNTQILTASPGDDQAGWAMYPLGTNPTGDYTKLNLLMKVDTYDVDVLAHEPPEESHDALHFYANAMQTFLNGTAQEFAAYYTAASADKYEQWIKGMTSDAYKIYRHDVISEKRRVRYLIIADPVYIVFYQPQVDDSRHSRRLKYDYIVRKGDQYKLTNFYYGSPIDDLFRDLHLFQYPVLTGGNK